MHGSDGMGRKDQEVEKLDGKDREREPYRYKKNDRGKDWQTKRSQQASMDECFHKSCMYMVFGCIKFFLNQAHTS